MGADGTSPPVKINQHLRSVSLVLRLTPVKRPLPLGLLPASKRRFIIENGRGGIYLRLTPEQYGKLRRA
jgi:hypothetical protein